MQGRQIRDSFFRLFPIIRVDDRDPISRRQCIQEIRHAVLVVLIEAPSGFAVLVRPLNNKKTGGLGLELFKFMKKGQAIVGGIRIDRGKHLHANTFDGEEFGCFGNGIAAG